jgi:hypothetical protein
MSTSYLRRENSSYRPGDEAAGPWSPDMLHGRLLGGLAASVLECEFGSEGWRVARLTVDMFRPAALEPIAVTTRAVRQGRRIRVADAAVTIGGTEVASARAVFLVEGSPPAGQIWTADTWTSPSPDTLPRAEQQLEDGNDVAWEMRIHEGGFGSSERSRVWTNETGFLVDEEPLTPLVRAALSADLASPLSNGGEEGIGYINSDYTLSMARYPVGAWVGLESTTHLAADGIAVGAATMYDLDGPFGTSTTSALSNPVLG